MTPDQIAYLLSLTVAFGAETIDFILTHVLHLYHTWLPSRSKSHQSFFLVLALFEKIMFSNKNEILNLDIQKYNFIIFR